MGRLIFQVRTERPVGVYIDGELWTSDPEVRTCFEQETIGLFGSENIGAMSISTLTPIPKGHPDRERAFLYAVPFWGGGYYTEEHPDEDLRKYRFTPEV